MKPQNRAESGISCMEKGLFQKSLLQKGFLTQNRAQKGKRAKIFFGKGRFRFQNRAIKTNNKVVFRMKEYFGSQKLKDPKRSVPCPRLRHPKFV